MYFSCILSKISYGIEVYGSATHTILQPLQILQNKLLRVALNKPRDYSSTLMHKQTKILKIADIYNLATLKFVFKCVNQTPIEAFENYFQPHQHQLNTRNRCNIKLKKVRTELGKSTTHYKGTTLWNDLSTNMKATSDLNNFTHMVRDMLINGY
jgi:hypothetical protein